MEAYGVDERELRCRYDRAARWYDVVEGAGELIMGLRQMRGRLAAPASGRVLEVAIGTGKNLRYYPPATEVTAVDLSEAMLERARRKAGRLHRRVRLAIGDAGHLPFPDDTFDTVVSSLSVCTFPDPVAALREMRRVCRTGGRIRLLEHGRSDRRLIGRWQDRRAERHARWLGCQWNREPHLLARHAGLQVLTDERRVAGVFHLMEAAP